MNNEQSKKVAHQVINKEKWWDILSRFIEVLRINIFIVDDSGQIILPPEEGKYGGRLLVDRSLGFDLIHDAFDFEKQFQKQGSFLVSENRFKLNCFAIPISSRSAKTIAYMIVGPVILNRRLDSLRYQDFAKEVGVDQNDLLAEINEIRVISNVMINSILDLLSEIVQDNVEFSMRKLEAMEQKKSKEKTLPKKFDDVAEEIYSTVRLDELLATLLDIALNMTGTECGSIMVMDKKQKNLTIKVSRGLDEKRVQEAHVKIGEGISGIAAKQKSSFVITGQEGNKKINHLLNRVFGILNLHTKTQGSQIEANLDNLQYLSKLLSSAF
jgi:hypothetical protein